MHKIHKIKINLIFKIINKLIQMYNKIFLMKINTYSLFCNKIINKIIIFNKILKINRFYLIQEQILKKVINHV